MIIDRFQMDRSSKGFLLRDLESGQFIEFTRKQARFVFCWLMERLSVREAFLSDGRSVKGFYQYEEVLRSINEFAESDNCQKDG